MDAVVESRLLWAISNRRLGIIKKYKKRGINLTFDDDFLLRRASMVANNTRIIRYLINHHKCVIAPVFGLV